MISLFLSSCQNLIQVRTTPTSVDTNEKKYLITTHDFVLEKNFKSAERENQRILNYYKKITNINDMVLSNYIKNSRLISDLLTRIIADEKEIHALYEKTRLDEEQTKVLILATSLLKKEVDVLEKKLLGMNKLVKKIQNLKNENKGLQDQIERLKEIDLNPDKVTGNPDMDGEKKPAEK